MYLKLANFKVLDLSLCKIKLAWNCSKPFAALILHDFQEIYDLYIIKDEGIA